MIRRPPRTTLCPCTTLFRSGVVGVGPGQLVDIGPVQVGHLDAEVTLEVGERAVDVDPGVRGVVGLPDRDRRPPEAVPADRPVAGDRKSTRLNSSHANISYAV